MNYIKALEDALAGKPNSKPYRLIEAARRYEQAKILTESRRPMTGAWWWLPIHDQWDLYTFYDEFAQTAKGTNHDSIWGKYVAPYLCKLLNIPLTGTIRLAYAGLPRGRVSLGVNGKYYINHGNDTPVKNGLTQIAKEFNLPRNKIIKAFEEHEQIIYDHYLTMKKVLKYTAPIKEPKIWDGWDEYDDEDEYDDWGTIMPSKEE